MSEPTTATMSATTHPAVLQRHPIRGVLWSLVMGIGLVVVLVVTKVISLDLTMMVVVLAIVVVVGLIWSTVAPARAPKGPPPATVTASTSPAVSRFDHFGDSPTEAASTGIGVDEAVADDPGDTSDTDDD